MKKIVLTLLTAVIIVSCMALAAIHKDGGKNIIAYAEEFMGECADGTIDNRLK